MYPSGSELIVVMFVVVDGGGGGDGCGSNNFGRGDEVMVVAAKK